MSPYLGRSHQIGPTHLPHLLEPNLLHMGCGPLGVGFCSLNALWSVHMWVGRSCSFSLVLPLSSLFVGFEGQKDLWIPITSKRAKQRVAELGLWIPSARFGGG